MKRYRGQTSFLWLVACLLFTALSACRSDALQEELLLTTQASLQEVASFGSNPGNLRMFRYAPAGLSADAPLVVALHAVGSRLRGRGGLA